MFAPMGIEVFPRAAAYLRPWAEPASGPAERWFVLGRKRWSIDNSDGATTIAVVGNDAFRVRSLATSLSTEQQKDRLHLRLFTGRSTEHALGLSIMRGERSVERELARVAAQVERSCANIIVIGDAALLSHAGQATISQWSAFLEAMRRRQKLVIVYETTTHELAALRDLSSLAQQSDLLIHASRSALNFTGTEPLLSDASLVTEVRGVGGLKQQQLA